MRRDTILQKRLGYEVPLIIVLTSFAFIYIAGNLVVTEEVLPWRNVIAHSLLLTVGISGMVFLMLKYSEKRTLAETPKHLGIGIVALSLPSSFLALFNPVLSWWENLQKMVFFSWAATIENIVFFYVFPMLLYAYGVEARRAWMGGVLLWLIEHAFVWELNVASIAIGFVFGMLQALVFEWTGSFLAICWSHGIYNAAMMGVNFVWLIIGTVLFFTAFLLRWYGERRRR